jgi:PAS domain S-box-containing protein/putative nucleotidyltransferase with HDIG domain
MTFNGRNLLSVRLSGIPWRTSLLYAVVAGAWIFFSDRALSALGLSTEWLVTLQTYKGWGFVGVTALLLYLALRGQLLKLEQEIVLRQKSEAILHYQAQLLENVSDAIISTDLEFRIKSWNRAAETLYGWQAQEVLGLTITDVVLTDLPGVSRETTVEQLMRDGQWQGEVCQQRRDGSQLNALSSVSLIHDEAGNETGVVAVNRDISERKQAEETLKRRLAELEAVHNILATLRDAQTHDEALPILLDETLAVLETDAGSIWLYHPDSNKLYAAVARGWFRQADLTPLKPGEGIVGRVFASGQGYISNEFAQDPAAYALMRPQIPEGWGGACVPIRTGAIIVGALFVSMHLPRQVAVEQVKLLESLADMAGASLHRMRLHEETVRRLDQLQALHNIDLTMTASMDLRMTLNILLKHVTSQLHVDAASVLLLNPILRTLEYSAGQGFRTNAVQNAQIRLGEGFAGRAALERRTIRVLSVEELHNENLFSSLLASEEFAGYFGVPLIAKGEVKGVLEVFHRSPFTPGPDWVEFLETLSGQAAIAIDSAQLFDSLQRANVQLTIAYDATIEGWVRALDLRDRETEGHSLRVTEMTVRLARALGIGDNEILHVRRGALLHDIGKMGIPDSILSKPGTLSDEEWEIMRKHPLYASEMLSPITYLRPALDIPLYHHEKWDGTGYPACLKGLQIPLAARIFAVVDVMDALCSERPYRKAWPKERALDHIRSLAGIHFDPLVVETFLKLVNDVETGQN